MSRLTRPSRAALLCLLVPLARARAQDLPTGDSVIKRIYDEGMLHSQAYRLGQALFDSIGPRLTGSAANRMANDWLVRTYTAWGISAKNEQYGTWRDWTRGQSRIELISPRVRTLEATMQAWSAATPPGGVTGEVVVPPPLSETKDGAGFQRWLATVRGKFVLTGAPQTNCRPEANWKEWAQESVLTSLATEQDSARKEWTSRTSLGGNLLQAAETAGAAGVLTNSWSRGWGVDKIQSARSTVIPSFDVSCEDYSLLARLAQNGQHPRIHLVAEATLAPAESPVFNTIATLPGTTKPNEYVMLSAHQDSWDSGSGATDNGTGTLIMMEAMRMLKAAYPNPKRTIIAGHWTGEEEGDLGSSAYAADHPDVIKGLQALFNQDNGTGNIDTVQTNGFVDAAPFIARWMSRMPADMTRDITIMLPGVAHNESSDSDAFDCRDAPGFFLTTADYDYDLYTWHTNRDTFDKISFAEIRRNATIVAMLAYEASEDPNTVPHTRRVPPPSTGGRGGRGGGTPRCSTPPRSYKESVTGRGGRGGGL